MDALDEINVNSKQNESDENESVDNQADLEKKKQNTNELHAEGNSAHTQIFIQNLGTMNASDWKEIITPHIDVDVKKYNLQNPEECSAFVEKYKNSDYLAMAIILSTFQLVALGDIPDMKEKLLEYLPMVEPLSDLDLESEHFKRDLYVSLDTILAVLGGQRFITEEGQVCASLGKESNQVLVNIWEQFPSLRNAIVSWLIHVNEVYDYRTNFDVYQVAVAFERVISLDFMDAKKRIFPKLYSNPNNIGLLGILAYKLYENIALRKEAEIIVLKWITSDSMWLWKSASLTHSYIMANGSYSPFEAALEVAISKRIRYFKKNDFSFASALLIQSLSLRSLFTNVFLRVSKSVNINERRILAQIYIELIRECYYRVDLDFMELPLVACDTKEQQESLTLVIEQTMAIYSLRKQLYAILGAYLKEISGYDYAVKVINHISAFFYNMGYSDSSFQQDILYFLRNCNNKAAKQIYERLCTKYEKKGEAL